MSDDLISRELLIENLNRFAPEHYSALVNDLIVKQPTAFDKKKTMQGLQEAAELRAEDGLWYVELQEALEIVEKGGIE